MSKQRSKVYMRDDVSTALSRKEEVKRVRKGTIFQSRVLNDYLRNPFQRFIAKGPHVKVPFSFFVKMRPSYYIFTNFVKRRSCLCTQHQKNKAFKLKMLKRYNKDV